MKTVKMSLATIQGKLSRAEMKNIMAGSGTCPTIGKCGGSCSTELGGGGVCVSGPAPTYDCNCNTGA
jgi:hypothetical protein